MVELAKQCSNMLVLDEKEVPWFPRHISDLDVIANRTLDAGTDLQCDHPGFNDSAYRARRDELVRIANTYETGTPIPHIEYQPSEIDTWRTVYTKLEELTQRFACKEYKQIMPLMHQHCGFSPDRIPQVQDISEFLISRTGFRLRPVAGLLSSRDFLSGLAFRVFFSTQYIRHPSRPLYTPEPDICHELLGHAPMFADPDFADFSQEIGLASLGASDADINRLATCYWHSVEFGLVREASGIKAYGAGLLSSFGELEYACGNQDASRIGAPVDTAPATVEQTPASPRLLPWAPEVAAGTAYPITSYQPLYFVADGLADAKKRMRGFCEALQKPFHARYNTLTSSVWVDRAVRSAAKPAGPGKYGFA